MENIALSAHNVTMQPLKEFSEVLLQNSIEELSRELDCTLVSVLAFYMEGDVYTTRYVQYPQTESWTKDADKLTNEFLSDVKNKKAFSLVTHLAHKTFTKIAPIEVRLNEVNFENDLRLELNKKGIPLSDKKQELDYFKSFSIALTLAAEIEDGIMWAIPFSCHEILDNVENKCDFAWFIVTPSSIPPASITDKISLARKKYRDKFITALSVRQAEIVSKQKKHISNKSHQAAKAAIMSRNFSHNVGSHALANPKLYTSIVDPNGQWEGVKQRLETFHGYIQGRLDFLAKAISLSADRAEPLFFLNDVMNGFFQQGVLLDTLIEDLGFPAKRIKFNIQIMDGDQITFVWMEEKRLFEAEDNVKNDLLVGIPGGMVGTHALYAFLENILRNSAKYGENISFKKETNLEINLKINECTGERGTTENIPAWVLTVWDNVSSDNKCEDIRKFINQPLINNFGDMNQEGHGIQEMKICADLLSGGLKFPTDKEYYEQEKKCIPCNTDCEPTEHYHNHINSQYRDPVSINSGQPIRCYANEGMLVYDLLIPIPTLLGIVPLNGSKNIENLPTHVKYYGSIEELAKNGANIGILLCNGDGDTIDNVLKKIESLHRELPFRLMVITNKEKIWLDKLRQTTLNRRLHIREDEGLKDILSGGDYNNDTLWDIAILQVYDAWLQAYKSLPAGKRWKLCIGFDHGGNPVLEKWKQLNNSCIDIYVSAQDADTDKNHPLEPTEADETALIFDNHGTACKGIDENSSVGFYQKFGLKEGLSLYQSLSSPPQSTLGFGLFVYSLVEGALTNVYILDERVAKSAEDCIDPGSINSEILKRYQAAKLSPLFAYDKFFISSIKEGASLELDNKGSCQDADILLIHEGVMDMLVKNGDWDKDRDTPQLFNLAPFIVRTSGRGRETRHLCNSISFLEFNEVSGNTFQELNKPRLVKSLLSSSGEHASNEKNDTK